jgi:hypothetical protein
MQQANQIKIAQLALAGTNSKIGITQLTYIAYDALDEIKNHSWRVKIATAAAYAHTENPGDFELNRAPIIPQKTQEKTTQVVYSVQLTVEEEAAKNVKINLANKALEYKEIDELLEEVERKKVIDAQNQKIIDRMKADDVKRIEEAKANLNEADTSSETGIEFIVAPPISAEKLAENEKIRLEMADKMAAKILNKNGTSMPKEPIMMPRGLVTDLMHYLKRSTKQPLESFGFIARGHHNYNLQDNTPIELLKKMQSAADELTENETIELETYLLNHHIAVSVMEDAVMDSMSKSQITAVELVLAFDPKTPINKIDRNLQARGLNAITLNAGIVGGLYGRRKVGSDQIKKYQAAKASETAFLNSSVISNGRQSFPLATAGATLKKRLAELYSRAIGIQKYEEIDDYGMARNEREWAAIVITLSGEWHINPSKNDPLRKRKTKKGFIPASHQGNGALPNIATRKLAKGFARVRSQLKKLGIHLVGLRTIEAHVDATPHMNVLCYFNKGQAAEVERCFRFQFGASQEAVEMKLGSDQPEGMKAAAFATYAVKYFTKFMIDNPNELVEEELTWRRSNKIRGFSFFGTAPITQYRLLRRSSKPPVKIKYKCIGMENRGWKALKINSIPAKPNRIFLNEVWKSARNGDYARYLRLTKGVSTPAKNRPIATAYDFTIPEKPKALPRKVPVGIVEVRTGVEFITKTLGEWKLIKNDIERTNVQVFNDFDEVTLALTLPRPAIAPAGKGGFNIQNAPPMIH